MQLTLYIGHNVKNRPVHTHKKVVAKTMTALEIDGCTAWEATGFWLGNGEKTSVIVIDNVTTAQIAMWDTTLEKLAKKLRQDYIHRTVTYSNSELISAERSA